MLIIRSYLPPQLHNPYPATPPSIEAYHNTASLCDRRQQNVIARHHGLQSSLPSPVVCASSTTNSSQLDVRAGNSEGRSDKSDKEQTSQKHAQPCHASLGSEDTPVSPKILVESDIDPCPDGTNPIGLLASLAISTSRGNIGAAPDKTHKLNTTKHDDEALHVHSFSIVSYKMERTDREIFFFDAIGRALPTQSISCQAPH